MPGNLGKQGDSTGGPLEIWFLETGIKTASALALFKLPLQRFHFLFCLHCMVDAGLKSFVQANLIWETAEGRRHISVL